MTDLAALNPSPLLERERTSLLPPQVAPTARWVGTVPFPQQFLQVGPATYNLQVTQISGFNGSVALTCSGAAATSICTISPSPVPPNGSPGYAFVVSVSNTSNVMLAPPLRLPRIPTLVLTCILVVLIFHSDSNFDCTDQSR